MQGCGKLGLGGCSRLPTLEGVEGRARSPGIRLGRDEAIWSRTCIQNQHKLVRTHSACIWCWDKPRANSDSHDTPRPGVGRCHHHPPYSILCVAPSRPHPSGYLSRDSPSGVPKLSQFWTPRTLGHHSFLPRPPIGMRSELNLQPSSRAFQRRVALPQHTSGAGRVRLLMVESQTANLTPGLSFAHNLGCRCPNDQCEAISDI